MKPIKKLNIKISIFLISIIIISGYFFISSIIGNDRFNDLKSILNLDQKKLVRDYIFPYKVISQQKKLILQLEKKISQLKKNIKSIDWAVIELQKKKGR